MEYPALSGLVYDHIRLAYQLAAAPTKEFDAKWGNPELFITNAYPGLWGHVREVGGIV